MTLTNAQRGLDANGNSTNATGYTYLNALPGTVASGSRAIDSKTETTVQLQNPALTSTTNQQQDEQGQDVGNANPETAPVSAPGDGPLDNPGNPAGDYEDTPMGDHSAQLPGVPTAVTAVAGAAGHATVGWAAPVDADGYAITGYVVTASSVTSGATTPVVANVGPVLTLNMAGLTSAKVYTFKVAAVNIAGTGPQSAATGNVTIG